MPANSSKPQDESGEAETPHYHGHRERLRERFYGAGPEALSDYELLEMALFPALPRRDTKPLAKALLKKFGSFAQVIHAPVARLREVDGIGEASINQIKLLAAAASRVAKGEIKRSIALSSWNDVIDYCRAGMALPTVSPCILINFIHIFQSLLASLNVPWTPLKVSFFVRFATRNCATRGSPVATAIVFPQRSALACSCDRRVHHRCLVGCIMSWRWPQARSMFQTFFRG